MMQEYSPFEAVKNDIRIYLEPIDGKSQKDHFDYYRDTEYKTNIDFGYENLDLHEDAIKIMMYMQNDIIKFSNGRKYKVHKREFQPCVPVMLILYVEEINWCN